MPWTSKCGQAVTASIALLEADQAFGQGDDGKALTYDRVVHELKTAADAKEAAMDTDHERTADTWSAPPIHSSWDIDNRPTTVPCRLVPTWLRVRLA